MKVWWGWLLLGRLHPVVVHLPLGLLTAVVIVEFARLLRGRPVPSETGTTCLWLGGLGAVAAVALGTLNASHQSITGESALILGRHQMMGWITIGVVAGTLLAARRATRLRQTSAVALYLALVLGTGVAVGATGHLGGELVYGSDYVTGVLPWTTKADAPVSATAEPAEAAPAEAAPVVAPSAAPTREAAVASTPEPAAAPVAPAPAPVTPTPVAAHEAAAAVAQGAVDFARDVKPIFEQTCIECHGPDKVKGRLRMDSVAALQKGGKSGTLLKPGDPENSLLLRRVLGLDDEDRMPLDKDPLTDAQIETLRKWIAAGAPYPAS